MGPFRLCQKREVVVSKKGGTLERFQSADSPAMAKKTGPEGAEKRSFRPERSRSPKIGAVAEARWLMLGESQRI